MSKIKGIGGKTSQKLLLAFKSVKNIKEADKKAIAQHIGFSKAEIVHKYFHPEN